MSTEWRLRFNLALHAPERPGLDAELDTPALSVAITGASGSGKTTLLRVLAGLEKAAYGFLEVRGRRWLDTGQGVFMPPWQRRVGWVPQDALLFPHLSVRENLEYGAARASDGPAFDEVVQLLEIHSLLTRGVRHLSGGERQRAALGRALLSDPQLLLLDEPFSALDRPLRKRVARGLRELRERHPIPILLVSHDRDDARELADEAYVLAGGRLHRETFDD